MERMWDADTLKRRTQAFFLVWPLCANAHVYKKFDFLLRHFQNFEQEAAHL